jgi:hypothetical protein
MKSYLPFLILAGLILTSCRRDLNKRQLDRRELPVLLLEDVLNGSPFNAKVLQAESRPVSREGDRMVSVIQIVRDDGREFAIISSPASKETVRAVQTFEVGGVYTFPDVLQKRPDSASGSRNRDDN